MPRELQTHVCADLTRARGVSLRASRLEFLEILIAAGWGDTPQERIPPDVIAAVEHGMEPRMCDTRRAQWPRVKDDSRTAHGLVRVRHQRIMSTISRKVCNAT